jgi:hypothetical protein
VTLTLGGAATFARASKGIAFTVPGSAPPGQPPAPTHVAPTGQQQPGTVPPATAPGVVAVGAGRLPPASPASDTLPAPAVAAAPGLAAVSSAAPSLPSLPTRLPAGWIVLAVVGAIACGLGVFYRLPLITSSDAGSGCPRGSQR